MRDEQDRPARSDFSRARGGRTRLQIDVHDVLLRVVVRRNYGLEGAGESPGGRDAAFDGLRVREVRLEGPVRRVRVSRYARGGAQKGRTPWLLRR